MSSTINIVSVPIYENTCCVIVTYHPDAGLPSRVAKIVEQVDAILIVDNASSEAELRMIEEMASIPGVHLIANDSNVGQSRALNQGMTWALEQGYQWMLTLDQDTVAFECLMVEMAAVYRSACNERRIALIGSNFLDRNIGEPLIPTENTSSGDWIDAVTCITSGSLVSLSAAQSIGPFREEFFIDQTDSDYCLRAKSNGFQVIVTRKPLIEHTISKPKECRLLWKHLFVPNSLPIRHYYFTRNHFTLMREYLTREPAWVMRTMKVRMKEIALIVLCEPDKLAKFRMILRGLLDSILGRTGPYPAARQ